MALVRTVFHHAVDQRAMEIEHLLSEASRKPHESANGPKIAREHS